MSLQANGRCRNRTIATRWPLGIDVVGDVTGMTKRRADHRTPFSLASCRAT
jgi:hypothetical protein